MVNATRKTSSEQKGMVPGLQRSYNEIVEHLDKSWLPASEKNLNAFKALDKALGSPSKHINAIIIAGTNGKGLTINFASQLLQKESLSVGSFYAPRILTYNEQLAINNEGIANKLFTELANEVLNAAQLENITIGSREILAATALLYFKQSKVDVALLELREDLLDPFVVCNPKVLAVTRVTNEAIPNHKKSGQQTIKELLSLITKDSHVVSADQSKANLQLMLELTEQQGGTWAMPIRKLAMLRYPFEQLHGRCAALAERVAQIYVEHFIQKNGANLKESLLAKQTGQRGRPTLEAKRQSELNPKRTVEQFWKETNTTLPAHFQVLDKEKPTILLDNARNTDALANLLLGVRLLHYQRPLKGITFILGCDKKQMDSEEFLKLLRYFAKKNSAQLIFCPITNSLPGLNEESWDVEQITNNIKSLKIKARATETFEEAFQLAKESVDERHGLVVITGSQSIIVQYWHHKGIKKI